MRLVLHLPLPTYQGEQALGRGPLGVQARDAIDHFHPFLACFWKPNVTAKRKDLCEPRPSAVAYEGRTRREMALRDAPMAKIDRLRRSLAVAPGRERKDQLDSSPQLRLVLFDDHAIIPALVDNRLRHVAWGQERVQRANTAFQDQALYEELNGRDRA